MGKRRRRFDAPFKARVALEAVRGEKTVAQLSSEYGVHTNQISQWKKRLLKELPTLFGEKAAQNDRDSDELTAELYRQIGKMKVELEWLKKKYQLLK